MSRRKSAGKWEPMRFSELNQGAVMPPTCVGCNQEKVWKYCDQLSCTKTELYGMCLLGKKCFIDPDRMKNCEWYGSQ